MKHIDYKELKEWEKDNIEFQLIDVREPEEHKAFNIGGSLIPLSEVRNAASQIATDRPVVFYCKRGIRSQIAIQKLQRIIPKGDFYNLANGILFMAH